MAGAMTAEEQEAMVGQFLPVVAVVVCQLQVAEAIVDNKILVLLQCRRYLLLQWWIQL
jgi:hypothetical protein